MSIKFGIARKFRKDETPSERLVWEEIRNRKFRGYKFRRQYIIKGFIVDFFCSKLKLALEIDGEVHKNQVEYDALRQEVLEAEGVAFLRIKVEDIDRTSAILNAWINSGTYPMRGQSNSSPPLHSFKNGEGAGGGGDPSHRLHPR